MVTVVVAGATLCSLQRLQMLQGPADAKRGAVKVAAAQLKGEEELAGKHQLPAPSWQCASTYGQNILQGNQGTGVAGTALPSYYIEQDKQRLGLKRNKTWRLPLQETISAQWQPGFTCRSTADLSGA